LKKPNLPDLENLTGFFKCYSKFITRKNNVMLKRKDFEIREGVI